MSIFEHLHKEPMLSKAACALFLAFLSFPCFSQREEVTFGYDANGQRLSAVIPKHDETRYEYGRHGAGGLRPHAISGARVDGSPCSTAASPAKTPYGELLQAFCLRP